MRPGGPKDLPHGLRSLSARLLLFTLGFVMLAAVMIYAPSVGRYRDDWLVQKIAAAHLGVLALEAVPDATVNEELKQALLMHVGAYAIVLHKADARVLIAQSALPMMDQQVVTGSSTLLEHIWDAFGTLLHGNRVIRLLGPSPREADVTIEALIDEHPLQLALLGFSGNILLVSVAISLFAAILVYASLHWLLVRPMRRLTDGVIEFAEHPENLQAGVKPSGRADEIGAAERVLAAMQADVRAALRQKDHPAALGAAVVKISHDLRGILSTAVLITDRLATSADPRVRRTVGPLLQAIERAIALATSTLDYARDAAPELALSRFRIEDLIEDVGRDLSVTAPAGVPLAVEAGGELELFADRAQLYRVLANLARNAVEAGADRVRIVASTGTEGMAIDVADNGPGLPEKARQGLFKPFSASTRKGGSGLGLAIAREVMRAHGGDIALVASSDAGTRFRLTLPHKKTRVSRAAAPEA
ncbi:MAG: HAMP domain-containing histidine kinase [Alphaproteobacteria bacterium]|nr:HAMP domain-containing histidine kinase [Alphaproteobacteria bacterium]